MGLEIARMRQVSEQSAAGEDLVELRRKHVLQTNRFGRELEPVDIGNMAAFLASEDARNVTGQSINVDGGFKMGV